MAATQEFVPLTPRGQDHSEGMSNIHLEPQPTQYRGYEEVPSSQPSPRLPTEFGKEDMNREAPRDWDALREDDVMMKHRIRRLRFVLRIGTLLFAIYMTISMIITLHKYLSTRHIIINGRNAWAKETTTWPTIMLLCTSSVTMLINFAVVVAYLKGISAANRTHDYASWIGAGIFIAHVGLWIVTATLYRTGKTGHDLWGWSCSPKAQKIQEPFKDVVNFGRYCHLQTSSWATSLAEAILTVFALVVYYLGYRRLKQRRMMKAYNVVDHHESRWSRMIPTKKPAPIASPSIGQRQDFKFSKWMPIRKGRS